MADADDAARARRRADLACAQLIVAGLRRAALFLARRALLIALDANRDNGLVKLHPRRRRHVDLGIFSRKNGIFKFDGSNADDQERPGQLGPGRVAWLVVGRILDRIIRP